jgi:hypothetical protein
VTFADSVIQVVRSRARIDSASRSDAIAAPEDSAADKSELGADRALAAALPVPAEVGDEARSLEALAAETAQDMRRFEPGLPDLEAAVGLVSTGLANRVVLSGFPSWSSLLARAYELADCSGVQVLPTVVGPGGKVDIVITRNIGTIG